MLREFCGILRCTDRHVRTATRMDRMCNTYCARRTGWASLLIVAIVSLSVSNQAAAQGRWTPDRAAAWQKAHGWLAGSNFIPSTAINQLEMWQADTFDPATIDRELGWAESLGFNSIRVFLHHLLWEQDEQGFLRRLDAFLEIAAKRKIGVMFVLFDSVWDPNPKLG